VKKRSSLLTKLFDSYTTNLHYMGDEQLVWIIGYDDRSLKNQENKVPQLLGHTKSYTKVVLDQNAESLSGQPAAALIGRVVKIKVTETHKWHISGHIIDANPNIPHVEASTYFAECERVRRERAEEEGEELNKVEVKVIEEKVKIKVPTSQVIIHLAGMAVLTAGVFVTLKGIFGGNPEASSKIASSIV
jgi:hypothetical protein